ncbi:MAG: hypothetical protein ACK5Q5_16930 [Planctomycetaceae bacterium]
MKLRRQVACLFAGPLAMVSGCAFGPLNGLAKSDPVIALEPGSPLAALEHSTQVQSKDADAGGFRLASLFRTSSDKGDVEQQRQVLLTNARRRMNQQMQQQMMMTLPLLMQGSQVTSGPMHPDGGEPSMGGPMFSAGPIGHSSQPELLMPQMTQPTQPVITPEMLQALTPQPPQRRGFRGFRNRDRDRDRDRDETRAEVKASREETAVSTEADRIERAAKAEAERAEKAALAEASIAERRLLAEAELAERMTRAELELAERLATAKEERDRRIAIAREERELRMAILGIDASELKSDPVDDALARIDGTKSRSADSSTSRFARFLRPRTSEPATEQAVAKTPVEPKKSQLVESIASNKTDSRDLVERSLDHSNEILDKPSMAEYASGRAADFPAIVRDEKSTSAHRDPLPAPEPTRDFDSLLAKEQLDDSPATPEDWSLLDDFLKSRQTETNEAETPKSLEFPLFATNEATESPKTAESSVAAASPAEWPTDNLALPATPALEPEGQQKRPEDDLWILGPSSVASAGSDASAETMPATTATTGEGPIGNDRPFPSDVVAAVENPEAFTAPGGLFSRSSSNAAAATGDVTVPAAADDVVRPAAELAASGAGSPPEFPSLPAENRAFGASDVSAMAAAATMDSRASSDPWMGQPGPEVASHTPPHFDWSQSVPESVDQVVHQPVPTAATTIHNATWVHQSLRDVCGPMPSDLESLVTQLDIPEAGVRKEVLEDLARMGSKARPAAPAIRVLLDDSPLVAAHAAWTLWQIEANETQTVNELLRLMQTGDQETVQFAAYALGSMGPKALPAAPALRTERERFSGATRVHVAEALTRIDAFDQASVEVLMYGLQNPETHVRWLSALALGEVQPRYATVVMPSLIGALMDTDPEVRSAVALTIGGFGKAAESAIPELQSRATLDAPSVQEAAQTALACIRR